MLLLENWKVYAERNSDHRPIMHEEVYLCFGEGIVVRDRVSEEKQLYKKADQAKFELRH